MDPCCLSRYYQKKEHVEDEMKKVNEIFMQEMDEEYFGNDKCAVYRKKLWDILEKPQTSSAARKVCKRWHLYLISDMEFCMLSKLSRLVYFGPMRQFLAVVSLGLSERRLFIHDYAVPISVLSMIRLIEIFNKLELFKMHFIHNISRNYLQTVVNAELIHDIPALICRIFTQLSALVQYNVTF
ncbi:Potassium voltage-gated channel subfamily B member 2 [Echinococcus granulosus]|uniref:Potassium voltage-gated channel subfamily B member 2 n=1 Tax=Echinococcus granulosus TaxID=6210 RepID=W6UV56_ECHGR|nr:Potassium voltage-gated channel subfamily B member 2 [Echinococcus granulosus]EUB57324.1 Potassium voltage-gated channel subfamily B member 2 [Echinococcus granulosus]